MALIERHGEVDLEDYVKSRWKHVAYCARYGHQQVSHLPLLHWRARQLDYFANALNEIVGEENKGGGG